MAIPGCNDGVMSGGSVAKSMCLEGDTCAKMSGCVGKSELLTKYENHDIVLSNEENSCDTLWSGFNSISHDTVVVGWGRQGIYEYWLLKESWGSSFGVNQGYMKI